MINTRGTLAVFTTDYLMVLAKFSQIHRNNLSSKAQRYFITKKYYEIIEKISKILKKREALKYFIDKKGWFRKKSILVQSKSDRYGHEDNLKRVLLLKNGHLVAK